MSTGVVYWSDVVYDIFGVDRAAFTPSCTAFLRMVYPQDRAKVEKKLAQLRDNGYYEITYRITLPSGDIRWLHEIADNTAPDDPDTLVGTVRDITVFKELELKLRKQTITDHLTGLFNRRYFMKRLTQTFALYQRNGQQAVVMLLDIDHFKAVNDTYGHAMGDQVLMRLADLFKERFRQTDVVGRLGGEEFAVLLVDSCLEDAAGVAEEIRGALAGMEFHANVDETFRVSVTCGLAGFAEDDASEYSILKRADDSLYLGKQSGRNQVVVESFY
ncbi:diguanylate cyclase (GGDEF) domain-containing protein [Franzmannia pantelleriensis]|uniref:diguanylate cyclase n=1 Tax=Franzmannia pantelleriensis TaxID=48727 RepID=A0A1G9NGM7_9GAMM|nr:sensor domain-containing diguanylate cyclase [Halomonas pantelleriensis]SDL85702.1 diguanylate cyclase (GGDEF) domain-containing protein [Halomonas pantelleriensis]